MKTLNRRQFISGSAATAIAASLPTSALSQGAIPSAPAMPSMHRRSIPSTGEELPVCGLGSTPVFLTLPEEGKEVPMSVVQTMKNVGGKVIDYPSILRGREPILGGILEEMDLLDDTFLSAKITVSGRQAGVEHLETLQRSMRKNPADLLMVNLMREMNNHWPTLKEWKEAGRTRYIGVTHTTDQVEEEPTIKLIESGELDIMQVNYSLLQPDAANRILPAALDNGVAVITTRPFVNGAYFGTVSGHELPEWASEFDCTSWAQFSLKYILSNPAVTCALSETSKPHHVLDNMSSGFGRLPDAEMRQRMFEYFHSLT